MREIVRRANEIGTRFGRDRIGKVRARVFGTTISDRDFIANAFGGAFPDKGALFAHFRARTKPSFIVARDNMAAALSELSPTEKEAIISLADKTCDHIFDLLGSGDAHLGDSIDWHQDFKTGYRWNSDTYYRDIKIPYGKADIKVPWELSRFYHAAVLGQAYQLTNNEKYAREFVSQVSGWINENNPKFGVNWNCTMDIAIRVCNWILGYAYFQDSPSLTDEFVVKFLKSLYQHGLHIRENLEYSETFNSNHYLSNIAGMVYLGTLFPEFKESAEWRTFGIRELKNEMMKQVYPDGCDFEASTCYHRLVLELFFYSTLVAITNDGDFTGTNYQAVTDKLFGREYRERLSGMFEAMLFLLKPNGAMPQIGDNDSGRLHVFTARHILDMRYLLCLGAIFFKEPKFKVREFWFCEEALWVFGSKGLATWQALEERTLAVIGSHAFPDAGWFVMRNERDYIVISCGPNGQKGNGGHAHNDKLSFELCMDGKDIFVDPGTYLYTPEPEMRNLFRSTSYHNTVVVNGMEQNSYDNGFLFMLRDESKASRVMWESGREYDHFIGEHLGFNSNGFHHRREVYFDKSERVYRIVDKITGDNPQSKVYFYLKPGVAVKKIKDGIFKVEDVIVRFSGFYKIDVFNSWYSKEYGFKESNSCIRVSFGDALETSICCEDLMVSP